MNAPPRSLFVTNLAWISIAVSSSYVLLAGLENLAALVVPEAFLPPAALFAGFPESVAWVASHLRELLLGGLALGIVALWASIDLMRRRPWSRIAMIVLLALLIVLLAASVAWQALLYSGVREIVSGVDDTIGATVGAVTIAVQVMVAIVALGTAAVFAWLGWRLMQPAIRAEFHS